MESHLVTGFRDGDEDVFIDGVYTWLDVLVLHLLCSKVLLKFHRSFFFPYKVLPPSRNISSLDTIGLAPLTRNNFLSCLQDTSHVPPCLRRMFSVTFPRPQFIILIIPFLIMSIHSYTQLFVTFSFLVACLGPLASVCPLFNFSFS